MDLYELVLEMKQLERRLTLYEEKCGISRLYLLHITSTFHLIMKRSRVPAAHLQFTRPNLIAIIQEVEMLSSI